MKKGDYLVAKENFTRTIWTVTRKDSTGEVLSVTQKNIVDFIKNQKYLISDTNNETVKVYYNNDDTVHFSLYKNNNRYEYYDNLFYIFNLNDRKAKLIRLNKIANEKILDS